MNKTIVFHGELGKKYGHTHTFRKLSYRKALTHLYKSKDGLLKDIRRGQFRMYVGEYCDSMIKHGSQLITKAVDNILHIIPVIRARKGGGKGFMGVVLGVALVAVAWWNPMGWTTGAVYLGMMGASIALNGAAMMFSPGTISSDYSDREGDNNKPSHMFKNSMRTFEQGQPVRLVFGEWKASSGTPVVASIYTEDI